MTRVFRSGTALAALYLSVWVPSLPTHLHPLCETVASR